MNEQKIDINAPGLGHTITQAYGVSGIYRITNPEGAMYFGRSVDIGKRWDVHIGNNEFYAASAVSASFSTHGASSHVFEVVELACPDQLHDRENAWLDAAFDAQAAGRVTLLNASPSRPKRSQKPPKPPIADHVELLARAERAARRSLVIIAAVKRANEGRPLDLRDLWDAMGGDCNATIIAKTIRYSGLAPGMAPYVSAKPGAPSRAP